jgi:hypothetical protein
MRIVISCATALISLILFPALLVDMVHAQSVKNQTDFQVLSQSNGRDGKHISLVILVPLKSKRPDVIALAETLKAQHKMKEGTVYLEIWDSKEAYDNRLNDGYPFCKLVAHKLVEALCNPQSGYDGIEWLPDKWADEIAGCR